MLKQTSCVILLLLFINGCTNHDSSQETTTGGAIPENTNTAVINENINVFDIPTLKTLFVTSNEGSHFYEKPDTQSAILDTLEYGYQVEVIGEEGEWYRIKERVSRNFIRNGSMVYSSGWEIVNIPKQNVGQLAQIKLKASDLYVANAKAPIRNALDLQLISEGEFNKARKKKDGFITKQERLISVKDSVLKVTIGYGNKKTYISTPDAEVEMQVYNYVGHISYLNAYLLAIGYYEGGEYILYNAERGEEIIWFNDYPEISPDGKYIVSMYTNPYEQSTDFQLHIIGRDKKIEKELEASFSNWMVALDPYEVYWVDNSTLLVKVVHSKAFWDETGNLNNDSQYLKMKIL